MSSNYQDIYRSIEDTKDANDFFLLSFFSCASLLYLHLSFTSLLLSKVLQNQNAIQTNQQIFYLFLNELDFGY
jgi:hypothetical protein